LSSIKHGRISILQKLADNPTLITCVIIFLCLTKLSKVQFVLTSIYLLLGAQNTTFTFSHCCCCNFSTFTARTNVPVTSIVVVSNQKAYHHNVSRNVNVSWVPLSHRSHTSPTLNFDFITVMITHKTQELTALGKICAFVKLHAWIRRGSMQTLPKYMFRDIFWNISYSRLNEVIWRWYTCNFPLFWNKVYSPIVIKV